MKDGRLRCEMHESVFDEFVMFVCRTYFPVGRGCRDQRKSESRLVWHLHSRDMHIHSLSMDI